MGRGVTKFFVFCFCLVFVFSFQVSANVWSPCYEALQKVSFFNFKEQPASFKKAFRKRIKKLKKELRYQEIAWALLDFKKEKEALKYINLLKWHLQNDEVVGTEEVHGGGSRWKMKVTLSSGIQAMAKKASPEKEEEVASYEIMELAGIGMMPVTVFRNWDGEEYSFQYWVPNANPTGEYGTFKFSNLYPAHLGYLMDYLYGYGDRHRHNELWIPWNWGYGISKRIFFIDYGWAWQVPGEEHWMAQEFIPDEALLEREIIRRVLRLNRKAVDSRIGHFIKDNRIKPFEKRRKIFLDRAFFASHFDPQEIVPVGKRLKPKNLNLEGEDQFAFDLKGLQLDQEEINSLTVRASSGTTGGTLLFKAAENGKPFAELPIPSTGSFKNLRDYTVVFDRPTKLSSLFIELLTRNGGRHVFIEWIQFNK